MPRRIDHNKRIVVLTEAAWRVLVRDGVGAVSVRNVAAEAGLATGSLRRSFPTQSALLAQCLTLLGERVAARIRELPPAATPVEHALAVLGETLPLDQTRRVEMEVYLALGTTALSRPPLLAAYRCIEGDLRGLCRSVVTALASPVSSLSAPAAEREARHLHALVDGLALHMLRGDDPATSLDVLRAHLAYLAQPR